MAATIRDVSRRAGVSSATVSRAFSNPEKLTADTLKKVQNAARELDYKPNQLSTIFRSKKTNTVLVMVPDLSNAFFGPVLRGLERVAGKHGYSLLLSDTRDSRQLEIDCFRMIESKRADGIIQLGARSMADLMGEKADLPFVHAIESEINSTAPTVRIDNVDAARKIVAYLISLGHRKIGLIAGRNDSRITMHREAGYLEALASAGIKSDPAMVEYGEYDLAAGEQAGLRLLGRLPEITAIFCMSDDLAIGAMRAAKSLGRVLPEDLSVAGFDNIQFGAYCEPSLTSVTQPGERIGETAMSVMIASLKGEDVSNQHYVLPTDLIVRESTVPPKQ